MALDFPDPETFGNSGPKPHERIDPDDYHGLTEFTTHD